MRWIWNLDAVLFVAQQVTASQHVLEKSKKDFNRPSISKYHSNGNDRIEATQQHQHAVLVVVQRAVACRVAITRIVVKPLSQGGPVPDLKQQKQVCCGFRTRQRVFRFWDHQRLQSCRFSDSSESQLAIRLLGRKA